MSLSSVTCGPVTCNTGEVCCDPYCGRCIQPGQACEPKECLSPVVIPESEICGMTTCNVGFVCCNPSCGICAKPGEACSHQAC
ncbi:MAG: hypothetical protein KC776_35645 [Myxococcales bacterium]|nr:hypothetical protein [Myxococcales bacterium]MCB9578595.1 hypothetical protein [Polyangiaceae bacterium]